LLGRRIERTGVPLRAFHTVREASRPAVTSSPPEALWPKDGTPESVLISRVGV
jgi:hypothetical protein